MTRFVYMARLACFSIVFLLCCSTLPAWSQARFDNSIVDRGLPIRQIGGINAIAQDHYGFIWIAGENGLARYDGINLRLYQSIEDKPDTLTSNYVWDIAVDRNGDLWIATNGGLCVYHQSTGLFERIQSVGGKALTSNVTISLLIDKDLVYVGSTVGLDVIDPIRHSMTSYLPNEPESVARGSNIVQDISVDHDGVLWLATELTGVARLNRQTGKFDHFYHEQNNPNSLSSSHIRRIYHDSKRRMWVGTFGSGLDVFDPQTGNFTHVVYPAWVGDNHKAVVSGIIEDEQGYFWISIDQQGLLKFDTDMHFIEHFGHSNGDRYTLLSNQVRTAYKDQNNDLWIGLFPFGISFFDRSKETIQGYRSDQNNPNSLTNDSILSIKQASNGIVWIGTESGLNSFDPLTQKITRYASDPANPNTLAANAVLNIEEGTRGELWVGTWSGGLNRFDPATGIFKRYAPNAVDANAIGDGFVWALFKDHNDRLWVGTETGGLQYYRPETDDFGRYIHDPTDPQSISTNYIRDIVEDDHGHLWLAGPLGINIFDMATQKFSLLTLKNGEQIQGRHFFSIFKDSRGYIWSGGDDKGVLRIDPVTRDIKSFDVRDGLPSPTVSSIREDRDGYIWLATYNGLVRLHPDTFAPTLMNVENGLVGATYNRDASLLDKDGRLYFGSTEGLTTFKPEGIISTTSKHAIFVTNFRVYSNNATTGSAGSAVSKSIVSNEAIRLDHTENMFSFDFVMLNYRNSALNQYAYKLEGFSNVWNNAGSSTTATYTNMDPGHYVFHVKAKAPGEDWVEMESPIVIDIAPPLWQRWWAYLIYVGLAVLLVYVIQTLRNLRNSSDAYKQLSLTDALSGAYNRAGIAQIVEGLFANREMKSHVCLLLMDIDYFKKINDERGHNTGDHVIKELVRIARSVIREGDSFGRWGGEEFLVLCPHSTPNGAVLLAEKIRKAVEAHQFGVEATPLRITISIGIALVQANETFEDILEHADKALYEAKAAGRNQVILAKE